MKKGLIVGLFICGTLVLGATAGFVIAYEWNAQQFSIHDSNHVAVKNNEVFLSDNEHPLYPGEERFYTVDVEVDWGGKSDVTVYFHNFEVSEDAVSVVVSYADYSSPSMPINAYTEESPLKFEANLVKGNNSFKFTYTVNELGDDVEDISLTFRNTIRVEKRVGGR